MKYSEVLLTWWAGYKNEIRETTRHKKQYEIDAHILPYFGHYDVEMITGKVLQDFITEKLRSGSPLRHPQGLSPATIKDLYKILKQSLDYAVAIGEIEENPCKGVKLPKIEPKEIQVFKPAEIKKLIAAARPKWLGDMILLAYRTGMRRGEIYGLKWDDIDIENGFLMVRRTIAAYKPGVKLIHPLKTKKSIRRIMLDIQSMDMLKRRCQKKKSEWVFCNQHGELMSPWYITKYMALACKAARIPHRSFHTLRHTHATMLLAAEVNPKIVQERLGHSKITMTLDTYSHVLPTMQAPAIEALNKIS